MAKETVTRLLDDMEDGVEADLTIEFGLEGKRYEMELSNANALKLRSLLSPWIANARPAGRRTRNITRSTKTASEGPLADYSKDQRAAVRTWAMAQGMQVSPRGRISADIVKAYELAHEA